MQNKNKLNNSIKIAGSLVLIIWITGWWAWTAWQNRILLHTYKSLLLPWRSYLEYFPWVEIIPAAGAMFFYWLTGNRFLRCLDIYIPKTARIGISFVIGLSICTFVGELLGIAGLFSRWYIIAALFFVFIIINLAAYKRQRIRPYNSKQEDDYYSLRRVRNRMAGEYYENTLILPSNKLQKGAGAILLFGTFLIVLLTFYHGVLFPMAYWDSFSYLGMARMLMLEHHFPRVVVAQMGIGTGSNYPQMYRLASALPCSVAGSWTTAPARMLAPLAGLFSLLLVYHTILRITRTRLIALSLALIFACIPYGIRFFTFTSDYSLTILFTAAFLYLAWMYVEKGLKEYLILSGLVAAFACHINYLMPLLGITWLIMIVTAHAGRKEKEKTEIPDPYDYNYEEIEFDEIREPDFTYADHESLFSKVKNRRLYLYILIFLMIASPWYIRNIIVTGNPVYPYFSGIFDGKRINPEVMESMQGEWLENGDGISKAALALFVKKQDNMKDETRNRWLVEKDEEDMPSFSLYARIMATPYYFITSRGWSWALAPVFMAFCIPGLLIFLQSLLFRKRLQIDKEDLSLQGSLTDLHRFGIPVLFLFTALFGYHYLMAGYYLYQIIAVIVPIIIFTAFSIQALPGKTRNIAVVIAMAIFILPGLPFAMMNFKIPHQITIEGKKESPVELALLRRPGLPDEIFNEFLFGADMRMLRYVNKSARDKTILTHDNRYLLYHPSIKIVHLDDWRIQKLYNEPEIMKKLETFNELNIFYYLKITMQEKHRILERLQMEKVIELEYVLPAFVADSNELYFFDYKAAGMKNDQNQEVIEIIIHEE